VDIHVPKGLRISALVSEFLWAVILVPILAISWVGFYTIARDIGAPVPFAAGLSAAFDGMALFAARIGLKHRRKGYSGFLARTTVIVFAGLGAFVQSFHAQSETWIHAHSWVVWSIAPISAALAYELHLGWVHRKQLAARGYVHPSARAGYGVSTWVQAPWPTLKAYREVLRTRRDYITKTNLKRFRVEEAAVSNSANSEHRPLPRPRPRPTPRPTPRPPVTDPLPIPEPAVPAPVGSGRPRTNTGLHSVPNSGPMPNRPRSGRSKTRKSTPNTDVAAWCVDHGYKLGYGNRVPIDGLRAYRAAHKGERAAS
jgi:hypothetical protein